MNVLKIIRILLAFVPVLPVHIANAAPDVRVVGLFSDRAVVVIDGRRTVMRAGQTGPHGVKLIAADSEVALLEIDGESIEARMDGRVTARRQAAPASEVQVWRNPQGMYTTVGSINGLPVSFMVDTGATLVTLNSGQARRLGIDYRVTGSQSAVTTASGVEPAWSVMLDRVRVGELELHNVAAVVLEGAQPRTALLGMSYLGRLEISNSGRRMTLKKKF
jgi:aspartyl protease family protein